MNDVTSAYACLCLWGPRARDVLQPLTKTPLDFKYMSSREISVGNVPVLASRVTYVGELGWELYCPTEYGLQLWDALPRSAASPRAATARSTRSGSRRATARGRATSTPRRRRTRPASSFAVKRDKGDFIGRDALREPEQKLVCLVLDDPRAIALGSEPVRAARRRDRRAA